MDDKTVEEESEDDLASRDEPKLQLEGSPDVDILLR